MADPITTDVVVCNQGINIEVESIAPTRGYDAEAFDVVNMRITPTVDSPALATYRPGCLYRGGRLRHRPVVSGTKKHLNNAAEFRRIAKEEAEIIRPISATRT